MAGKRKAREKIEGRGKREEGEVRHTKERGGKTKTELSSSLFPSRFGRICKLNKGKIPSENTFVDLFLLN